MIYGIGIDLVELDRLKKLLAEKEDKFIKKILHPEEISVMPKKEFRKLEFIAGRFAGKEAVAKALGTGIGKDIGWQEIIILNDSTGKPIVKIKKDHYTNLNIHISISHTSNLAVAKVIIEQM